MSFKADLHVHTHYSGDNDAIPEEMVESAINLGLEGIAFTEHYSFEASEYAEALRQKYHSRIRIFRGVEVSSSDGHILVFGLNTDRLGLGGAPAGEVVRLASLMGGIAIPSHPYRRGSSLGDLVKDMEGIGALEGYNGCNLHMMNMMAVETAALLRVPCTGGSDAHSPSEVGSCYTEFAEEVTEDNFIESLKAGRYTGRDTRKISRKSLPILWPLP
jgi:predicted metal-dependent phosphoesterase TrpH